MGDFYQDDEGPGPLVCQGRTTPLDQIWKSVHFRWSDQAAKYQPWRLVTCPNCAVPELAHTGPIEGCTGQWVQEEQRRQLKQEIVQNPSFKWWSVNFVFDIKVHSESVPGYRGNPQQISESIASSAPVSGAVANNSWNILSKTFSGLKSWAKKATRTASANPGAAPGREAEVDATSATEDRDTTPRESTEDRLYRKLPPPEKMRLRSQGPPEYGPAAPAPGIGVRDRKKRERDLLEKAAAADFAAAAIAAATAAALTIELEERGEPPPVGNGSSHSTESVREIPKEDVTGDQDSDLPPVRQAELADGKLL